jgi:hypothetical protein
MIGAAVWAGARSPNQEMASSGRSFRVAFGTGRVKSAEELHQALKAHLKKTSSKERAPTKKR